MRSPFHVDMFTHVIISQVLFRQACLEVLGGTPCHIYDTISRICLGPQALKNISIPLQRCPISFRYSDYFVNESSGGGHNMVSCPHGQLTSFSLLKWALLTGK